MIPSHSLLPFSQAASKLSEAMSFVTAGVPEAVLSDASQSAEEMFFLCSYDGVPCELEQVRLGIVW